MPAIDATSKIVHESLLITMTFSHSQECRNVVSTPLNRSGGFVGDAVDDRTDFTHFIGDATGNFVEKFIGELGETRGEYIVGRKCPQCDHPSSSRVVSF